MERVDAVQRLITFKGEPKPPEPPSMDEWRDMQVQLRTYGSVEVAKAYEQFADAIGTFYERATAVRHIEEHGEDAKEYMAAREEMEQARLTVREALRKGRASRER
jgi:hypothetical protein